MRETYKNKYLFQEGGQIAHNTRKELEQKIGKLILSKENFLNLEEKKQIEHKKKAFKKMIRR